MADPLADEELPVVNNTFGPREPTVSTGLMLASSTGTGKRAASSEDDLDRSQRREDSQNSRPPTVLTKRAVVSSPPRSEHRMHEDDADGERRSHPPSPCHSYGRLRRSVGSDCEVENVACSDASLDSFGMPAYVPLYPEEVSTTGELNVPWNLRAVKKRKRMKFFDFLRLPQFWWQVQFALRITAIAVLVPASLIAARLPNTPFVSASMPMSASVLAAKQSAGEAIAYLFTWARAGCLWLPLAVIGGALNLGKHISGWCVYYTFILLIMATFTEGMVRRICLLLFNVSLVGMLVDPARGAMYPCRVMGDWCIGTGLCTVASFLPYPVFCYKHAHGLLSDIAKNTATAFRGLVFSFWSPTNVSRNMAMTRVRYMTKSLDELLPAFEHYHEFSFFEFLFESAEVRDLRWMKFRLFERLRVNLSSMTRVLDMVEQSPGAIDNSERSNAFCDLLMPHLNSVAMAFDELMERLKSAFTKRELLNLQDSIEKLKDKTDELQDAYVVARRTLFYEHTSSTLEEFVPLMTFYLFTVVCFRDTVEVFEMEVKEYKSSFWRVFIEIFKKTAYNPFMDNVRFLYTLFKHWHRREVQSVVEAAKVSGAMILTIGFSYLIKVDMASFSGPNIIAFVSGSNPVEAVQASVVRLTGCLIGTVLGFFAGTYSKTAVQRVASLCTLMFCGTFLRNDKEYGVMAVYAMFVLIPLDSIMRTTMEDTVARMNQNTFGVFIYLFVSALVFPLSPGAILRRKRANVLRRMSEALSKMMGFFSEPLMFDTVHNYCARNNHDFHDSHSSPAEVAIAIGGDQSFSPHEDGGHENGAEARGKKTLSIRSFHMALGKDTPLDEANEMVSDVIKRLKDTKVMMGFAKEERTLVEVDYPVKACESTYLRMYHMTFLLKTMLMSWNVMRSQYSYTPETRRMHSNLQSIATDVARSFQRFVSLMTYMMMNPAVNLEADVRKAVLDLMDSSVELHKRKSQIMLMLINDSVSKYRAHCTLRRDDQRHKIQGEGELRHTHEKHDTTEPMWRAVTSPRLPRASTFDGVSLTMLSNSAHTSPVTKGYGQFKAGQSERNVSIAPYLRNRRRTKDDEVGLDEDSSPVALPTDFIFPVTSEDAEGLHSLTLCLEMFSDEAKLLMMSLASMHNHFRSKM